MLARTGKRLMGMLISHQFIRNRRARPLTSTLVQGVVASLLLTSAPAFAASAHAAIPQHRSASSHKTAQRVGSATRSPTRHASLHRRGRAFARHDVTQDDAELSEDVAPTRDTSASTPVQDVLDRGVASWYSVKGNGLRTSSGERFDENALTAAHTWLPLGTKVRVTVAGTNESVIVTINDRQGSTSRVIDLSKGAARELGILGRGTARVILTRA